MAGISQGCHECVICIGEGDVILFGPETQMITIIRAVGSEPQAGIVGCVGVDRAASHSNQNDMAGLRRSEERQNRKRGCGKEQFSEVFHASFNVRLVGP